MDAARGAALAATMVALDQLVGRRSAAALLAMMSGWLVVLVTSAGVPQAREDKAGVLVHIPSNNTRKCGALMGAGGAAPTRLAGALGCVGPQALSSSVCTHAHSATKLTLHCQAAAIAWMLSSSRIHTLPTGRARAGSNALTGGQRAVRCSVIAAASPWREVTNPAGKLYYW